MPPTANNYKAAVRYHLLKLGTKLGKYDKKLFQELIKLPSYAHSSSYQKKFQKKEEFVTWRDPNLPDLPKIDESQVSGLLRQMMLVFFADTNTNADFVSEYFEESYYKPVLAEAKLTSLTGRPETWANMLTIDEVQRLKDKVELEFVPNNQLYFAPDDNVNVTVSIKNVTKLFLKVFEINTDLYYRVNNKQIPSNINLDGLVANHQEEITFSEPPIKRFVKSFEFPKLNRRGLFVVEVRESPIKQKNKFVEKKNIWGSQ